jgi:Flp pilus assembly protein CpaB
MVSFRRKLPPATRLAFLGAVLCAGSAAWLVVAQMQAAQGAGQGAGVSVVVAARDLEPGATIATGDVEVAPLDAAAVPPAAITDPTEPIGRLTLTPFAQGEVLTTTRLALAAGPASRSVPPGSVGVTLTPDASPAGLGGGDRVDVLATYATARPYTSAVAEDVVVLSVAEGGAAFGQGSGPVVTLLLDPYVAREVVRADVTAHVSLVVRGYEPVP